MVTVKEHPMDNCQLFVQLRNMFHAYDSQTKRLSTFLYWSGNEEHIDELCLQVVRLLVEHELVIQLDELQTVPTWPEALTHLRGVLILLLVNTATTEGQWSLQCQHLCQQLPQLPQFLTVAIAMRCGLKQPLLEFLECGPRWATFQYFGVINETMTHLAPDRLDELTLTAGTLKAAGRALMHHQFADKNEMLVRELGRMLQRHLLDSAERLAELRPTPRKIYLAKAMNLILEVIIEVLGDPKALGKPAYFQTYSGLGPEIAHGDSKNDPKPCAKMLMDALQRLVEEVSVATFMHWMEVPSPKVLYNFQALICCQSADLLLAVQPYTELGQHTVCAQLQSFGEAAQKFEAILADMTIGELLAFLDGDVGAVTEEQLLAGLECLLGRPIAFGNDECVETMAKHVQLMGEKHAKLIMSHLQQVAEARKALLGIKVEKMEQGEGEEASSGSSGSSDDEEEDEEGQANEYASLLQLVLLPIFTQCSIPDKILLLQFRDELDITKDFPFEAPGHQERRISFFNNLNSHSPALENQLLIFCYENPDESWLALAKLAMTHSRFAHFFWRVAVHCPRHSARQMINIADSLLQDDQLLLKRNALRFLISVYVNPLVLNGLSKQRANTYRVSLRNDALPYTEAELKTSQSDFLDACAEGLAKFTRPLSYPYLRRILRLLIRIAAVEQKVRDSGRHQLRQVRAECWRDPTYDEAYAMAKHYVAMHENLPEWRQAHFPLIAQLMSTIDALRWNLAHFDRERVDILGLAGRYWRQNMNSLLFLEPEFRGRIDAVTANLKHKEFVTGQMPSPEDPNYRAEFIRRVTQASAREATILFRQSIESRTDCVLFFELAKAVEQEDCESAEEAYIFLFGCHVSACRKYTQFRKSSPRKQARKREMYERLTSIVGASPRETIPEVRKKLRLMMSTSMTK